VEKVATPVVKPVGQVAVQVVEPLAVMVVTAQPLPAEEEELLVVEGEPVDQLEVVEGSGALSPGNWSRPPLRRAS